MEIRVRSPQLTISRFIFTAFCYFQSAAVVSVALRTVRQYLHFINNSGTKCHNLDFTILDSCYWNRARTPLANIWLYSQTVRNTLKIKPRRHDFVLSRIHWQWFLLAWDIFWWETITKFWRRKTEPDLPLRQLFCWPTPICRAEQPSFLYWWDLHQARSQLWRCAFDVNMGEVIRAKADVTVEVENPRHESRLSQHSLR